MADLRGRVALVTGGERGLGEAIALQLSGAGAAVAVMAPRGGDIDDVAREIEESGGRALPVTADLSNPTQIASACEEVANKFGAVEILINNESAIGLLGPFAKINIEEWVYADAINLLAGASHTTVAPRDARIGVGSDRQCLDRSVELYRTGRHL